ncbi:MAG: hypothetical protein QOF11_186 [Chloroflexota bacterium]|nr:hypothetical protein [Chloroflexota bacterium]
MSEPEPTPAGRRLVLLLNNPFVADSRSWKLARSLAEADWTVTVVARTGPDLPAREVRDRFTVVRVAQPRPLAWLRTPPLPDAATGDPGRHRVSGPQRVRAATTAIVGRSLQALRYLRLSGQWAAAVADAVPAGADIWQAEGMITLPVALGLRKRLGGRVVYDARDLQVESSRFARLPGPWRWLLSRRERAWARSADATITTNEPYAEVLAQTLGVRATVVYNGPFAPVGDPGSAARAAAMRERLGIPSATPIVLYLGSVAPGRGVEQLCRAMADVPAATLLVVGPGGAFRETLMAAAAQLPVGDRIRFLPGVAPEQIPDWTAAADVAVMPILPTTLNHRLTTPTRLFDALGAGVPVVASDLPGMAAIVRTTGAGVLCDPADPGSIARAVREVLDAPPERRRAYREAALAAGRGYAWEHQIEALVEVFRRVSTAR